MHPEVSMENMQRVQCFASKLTSCCPLVCISKKDESHNLCHKSSNTIKAIQKVNILCAHFLPLSFGKLGHSIISQLVHLWAAEVIGDRGENSAEAKVAHSPQQSLKLNAWMKTQREEMEMETERKKEREEEEERKSSKVPHSLAQGFMGLLPAVTLCSESAAP